MSAPQPTPGPDLDYAIAQYHREKEARRDAQRDRDALAAEVERLRAERDALKTACESARIALEHPDSKAWRDIPRSPI